MITTFETRAIHVSIACEWTKVYAFASNPHNMALWASGLGSGLKPSGDHWLADGGPIGEVKVTFAAENDLGVLDHWVEMPSGLIVYNAFRIVQNGDGAEAIFLVTRLPGMSAEQFESDARHVEKDLRRLKQLLEEQITA
ncbi:SRPBCC family protein [Rhizobium helianthi]|uniref:SRPBCC family protein n=1 Tax=Rhizobium helianthi TaxID=1132695 RepID=A0ABW4LYH1_9HYPH